jgi:hypothetical protein
MNGWRESARWRGLDRRVTQNDHVTVRYLPVLTLCGPTDQLAKPTYALGNYGRVNRSYATTHDLAFESILSTSAAGRGGLNR